MINGRAIPISLTGLVWASVLADLTCDVLITVDILSGRKQRIAAMNIVLADYGPVFRRRSCLGVTALRTWLIRIPPTRRWLCTTALASSAAIQIVWFNSSIKKGVLTLYLGERFTLQEWD